METTSPIQTAEATLNDLADKLFNPLPGECLLCYLYRNVNEFGCNGTHRFTLEFRNRTAPRATALMRRIRDLGACCCECELFLNGFQPRGTLWQPGGWVTDEYGELVWLDAEIPDNLPSCTGVRRGSTQPCTHWIRVARRRGW